jgi:hypothetical protein
MKAGRNSTWNIQTDPSAFVSNRTMDIQLQFANRCSVLFWSTTPQPTSTPSPGFASAQRHRLNHQVVAHQQIHRKDHQSPIVVGFRHVSNCIKSHSCCGCSSPCPCCKSLLCGRWRAGNTGQTSSHYGRISPSEVSCYSYRHRNIVLHLAFAVHRCACHVLYLFLEFTTKS